jgi:hypothetical protein
MTVHKTITFLLASYAAFGVAAFAQESAPALPTTPTHLDTMTMLGEVICDENLYTRQPASEKNHWRATGDMQILTQPIAEGLPESGMDQERTRVEVQELAYGTDLTIGTYKLHVAKMVRIPYTYPVYDREGKFVGRHTESLIVGYAGAEGGG